MKKNKILKVIFGVALVSLPLAAATAIKRCKHRKRPDRAK